MRFEFRKAAFGGDARFVAATLAAGSAIAFAYGPSAQMAELLLFAATLGHLSATDAERRVIPNACVAFALAVRVAYLALGLFAGSVPLRSAAYFVASAIALGSSLLLASAFASRRLGVEPLGGGDVKLLAVSAAYFGFDSAMRVVALACFGSLLAVPLLRRLSSEAVSSDSEKGESFAFGPFIAFACVVEALIESPLLG